jgi:hypothetical protein
MPVFDEIAERNGDDECRAWLRKVFDAKDEIITFAAACRGGASPGRFVGYLRGSFNLSLRIEFGDGEPDAIIRFPKPGHTSKTLADEKVANEVNFMKSLSQNTTIPIPRLIDWGLAKESPQNLGPFIIMDFVHGTRLSTLLMQPTDNPQDDVILNSDIDNNPSRHCL